MDFHRDYKLEHEGVEIIETEQGFVTYKMDQQNSCACILELYVAPTARKSGHAQLLIEQVRVLGREAGLNRLITNVDPNDEGAERTRRALEKAGMQKQDTIHVPFEMFQERIS